MKFQVSDGEKYQKIMEAEISVEEMELPIRIACKRLAQKVNIPGFRKGKAPRSVLENYVGLQAILEEAADDILPKAYVQGLKDTGLEPVAQPEISITQLDANEPMKFTATITVKPEVQLGQYKELAITRRIMQITDADIDRDLAQQQQRLTKLVEAGEDAEAVNGDTVTIDFKGLKDGVAFDGGTAENYPLSLGSGSFIPGFEEQLIGAKKGESREVNVTFPEDYQEESLAGQPVVFEVTVKEIKTKQIPELDEDFIHEVSETAEDMEQLRAEVRQRLTEDSQHTADDNAHGEALMKAVENAETDIPPVMIEQQIDDIIADTEQRLGSQGLNFAQFLEYTGQTMEQVRETYQEQARMMVKRDLVVEAIVKAEDIQADEKDVGEEIEQMAAAYWQPPEKIREALEKNDRIEDLKYSIRAKKATELVFEQAVITDELVDREKLMMEAAAKAKAEAEAAAETEEIAEVVAEVLQEAAGDAPEEAAEPQAEEAIEVEEAPEAPVAAPADEEEEEAAIVSAILDDAKAEQ